MIKHDYAMIIPWFGDITNYLFLICYIQNSWLIIPEIDYTRKQWTFVEKMVIVRHRN